jgi:hypothetical protein
VEARRDWGGGPGESRLGDTGLEGWGSEKRTIILCTVSDETLVTALQILNLRPGDVRGAQNMDVE